MMIFSVDDDSDSFVSTADKIDEAMRRAAPTGQRRWFVIVKYEEDYYIARIMGMPNN